MAISLLQTLIDKQDNFEIIRDQIAAIIVAEQANQQALATAATEDPDLWKLRTYLERSNPLEQWLNVEQVTDFSPILNIWVDNSGFDGAVSNVSTAQKSTTIFNIDCYGLGVSKDDGAGHLPGDELANKEVQRAVRLVRNILMAAENTYLQLQGLVWKRWPQSINFFQPEIQGRPVQHISGARIALAVGFNEFSPQYVPVDLAYVAISIERAEDGMVILEADYPSTP